MGQPVVDHGRVFRGTLHKEVTLVYKAQLLGKATKTYLLRAQYQFLHLVRIFMVRCHLVPRILKDRRDKLEVFPIWEVMFLWQPETALATFFQVSNSSSQTQHKEH